MIFFTARFPLLPAAGLTLLLLVCCLAPARAWNSTGHMTVAGIAYDNLTPKTKARVDALLQKQRDYPLWIREMPAGYTNRARFAFMKAATWPDDIRRTPDDRPIWHYIDIPVIAPGYKPDPLELVPVKPNAETQIPVEAALLADKRASDGDRAVALCWVEHLVGDIHQPLHDSSLFSAVFPKGDRGGNSETVLASTVKGDPIEQAAHPRNLHALWDDMLGTTQDPAEIDKLAAGLETAAYTPKTYPQIAKDKTVPSWVQEGSTLARKYVYRNGTLVMTPSGTRFDVALPPGYLNQSHKMASRLIALAGLRLADLLNSMSL